MTTDSENLSKSQEPQSNIEFDWRSINPEALLANQKYNDLYHRIRGRQDVLNQKENISFEEEVSEHNKINKENESDENETLSDYERQEFKYFWKFKTVEDLKDLDPLMDQILGEFNRLPFITYQSDTGHIDKETGALIDDFVPAIVFGSGKNLKTSESDTQIDFIENIPSLNVAICERLDLPPYNILDLRGFELEHQNGNTTEMSIWETLEEGAELTLYINVAPGIENDPKEILTTIWDETYNYIAKFTGRNPTPLEFDNGNVFVK